MRRRRQAGVLLLVLGLTVSSGVLSLAPTRIVTSRCADLPACCVTTRCTMHSSPKTSCTCSVAPDESSLLPAWRADFHFDLPQASLLAAPMCSAYDGVCPMAAALAGFVSPPDQPPRNS